MGHNWNEVGDIEKFYTDLCKLLTLYSTKLITTFQIRICMYVYTGCVCIRKFPSVSSELTLLRDLFPVKTSFFGLDFKSIELGACWQLASQSDPR